MNRKTAEEAVEILSQLKTAESTLEDTERLHKDGRFLVEHRCHGVGYIIETNSFQNAVRLMIIQELKLQISSLTKKLKALK